MIFILDRIDSYGKVRPVTIIEVNKYA